MALEALQIWEKMQPNTTACAVRNPAIQALREALAHEALDRMVAENQRLGFYND